MIRGVPFNVHQNRLTMQIYDTQKARFTFLHFFSNEFSCDSPRKYRLSLKNKKIFLFQSFLSFTPSQGIENSSIPPPLRATFSTMKIPISFPFCFNSSCPRIATCLRFTAGKELSETKQYALSVLPHVLQANGDCPMYRVNTPIKGAYGFSTLFSNVKKKDISLIRKKVIENLGSQSGYYRYNNGTRLLTPAQQELILALFQEYGYKENLLFDHYCETYDLT